LQVAVDDVGQLLGGEMAEVDRLARIGADAGGDEHQPGQQLAAQLGCVLRQELPGLLGQIEQDRVAVEDGDLAVDDRRGLAVGVEGEERRLVLLAPVGVHRHQLVGKAGFFQEQGDFRGIGRRVVMEFQYAAPPMFGRTTA
jgi:hypothetical protein